MRASETISEFTSDQVARDFRGRLVRFIGSRVGNLADAEDIAQEVLLRVHRSIRTLSNADRLAPWLFQIANNAIVDHYRARGRAAEIVDPHTPIDEVAESNLASAEQDSWRTSRDASCCLDGFISQLDAPYSRALRLVDVEGLTNKAAAAQLGLSIPGVKSRVQRARANLRKALTACCALDFSAADGKVEFDASHRADGCGCGSVSTAATCTTSRST